MVAGMMTSIGSLKPCSKSQLVLSPHLRQQPLKKYETLRKSSRGSQEPWFQAGNRVNSDTRTVDTEVPRPQTRKGDAVSDWERLARVELIRKGVLCGVEERPHEASSEEEGEVITGEYQGYTRNNLDSVGHPDNSALDNHVPDGKCKANRKMKIRRHTRASTSSSNADAERAAVVRVRTYAIVSPKTECKDALLKVLDWTEKPGSEHHSELRMNLSRDTAAGAMTIFQEAA